MSPPRLVIFDMDDVLCHYDLGRRLRYLSQLSGKTPRDIRTAIWDSGFEGESDAGGYPDEKIYLREFGRRLGYDLSRDDWIKARAAAMTPKLEVLNLAKKIGQQTRLAVYTNNGPIVKSAFPQLLPQAADIFSEIFCSCEFGTKKPDPLSFTRFLTKLDIPPQATWFIDDKRSNVAGARLAGLTAHHFHHFEPLRTEAKALGLAL